MTTIEVMRKALGALQEYAPAECSFVSGIKAEIRAELERMEGVEPVATVRIHKTGGNVGLAWSAVPVEGAPLMRDGDKLYTAPIAPAIPALTPETIAAELARQAADQGHTSLRSVARWAYALAAERAGVEIKEEGK